MVDVYSHVTTNRDIFIKVFREALEALRYSGAPPLKVVYKKTRYSYDIESFIILLDEDSLCVVVLYIRYDTINKMYYYDYVILD